MLTEEIWSLHERLIMMSISIITWIEYYYSVRFKSSSPGWDRVSKGPTELRAAALGDPTNIRDAQNAMFKSRDEVKRGGSSLQSLPFPASGENKQRARLASVKSDTLKSSARDWGNLGRRVCSHVDWDAYPRRCAQLTGGPSQRSQALARERVCETLKYGKKNCWSNKGRYFDVTRGFPPFWH